MTGLFLLWKIHFAYEETTYRHLEKELDSGVTVFVPFFIIGLNPSLLRSNSQLYLLKRFLTAKVETRVFAGEDKYFKFREAPQD